MLLGVSGFRLRLRAYAGNLTTHNVKHEEELLLESCTAAATFSTMTSDITWHDIGTTLAEP